MLNEADPFSTDEYPLLNSDDQEKVRAIKSAAQVAERYADENSLRCLEEFLAIMKGEMTSDKDHLRVLCHDVNSWLEFYNEDQNHSHIITSIEMVRYIQQWEYRKFVCHDAVGNYTIFRQMSKKKYFFGATITVNNVEDILKN